MSNKSRIAGLPVTIAIAAIAVVALGGQAFAHAHLKSATPAVDGTVATAPTELDLNFSEGLDLKFSGVKVTGTDKAAVATGDAVLTNGDATLKVPLGGSLKAGTYKVDWHALSADGHKTQGSYRFTVKP